MQMTGAVREAGRDVLFCRSCRSEFPEGAATTDGWHYECPECGETGIGDALRRR